MRNYTQLNTRNDMLLGKLTILKYEYNNIIFADVKKIMFEIQFVSFLLKMYVTIVF